MLSFLFTFKVGKKSKSKHFSEMYILILISKLERLHFKNTTAGLEEGIFIFT